MADTPKRIQRKRTRGWRMPENAVYVGRPTKWGNPFVVGSTVVKHAYLNDNPEPAVTCGTPVTQLEAAEGFRMLLIVDRLRITPEEIRRELHGKDLACFCKPGEPCHADELMAIANNDMIYDAMTMARHLHKMLSDAPGDDTPVTVTIKEAGSV